MVPEEQEAGQKLLLPENAYNLSGSVQAIYGTINMENHAKEEVELCAGQRLEKVNSLHIEAWLREELKSGRKPEVGVDEDETLTETINSIQKSDYPTEESKRKFICESFKIEDLRGGSKPEVGKDEDETPSENVTSMQESDYSTEENKRKYICKSFKIDENEILNWDEKLKEEVIKMLPKNFSVLALHPKHYGKTNAS